MRKLTRRFRIGNTPELVAFTLTPFIATTLFVLACLAGYRYRTVWKEEGPSWQLWVSGIIAASCLLILGFVPLDVS